MAYKKAELEKQALAAIKEHNLFFIEDVVAYLPCGKKTFYNKELHELPTIKEALAQNRIRTKNGLRAKWYKDGNATTQIALYKLLGTQDELHRLTGQHIDHTTGGEKLNRIEIAIKNNAEPVTAEDDIDERIGD